ncbi:MAG: hypothetical protein SFY80_03610 [Verrucomicrobiota bacterium]|nr:hypothetical protein [Verrucomicrobiota bacterium]
MIATVDSKKRLVISEAQPGDIYDIQYNKEGQFTLQLLELPKPVLQLTSEQCQQDIAAAPLKPKMNWTTLKQLTREGR